MLTNWTIWDQWYADLQNHRIQQQRNDQQNAWIWKYDYPPCGEQILKLLNNCLLYFFTIQCQPLEKEKIQPKDNKAKGMNYLREKLIRVTDSTIKIAHLVVSHATEE